MSEEQHKHDRRHDCHKRVVHTHKTHINNLNLSGTHGPSVHHRHDHPSQTPDTRVPEGYVNVDVYLARAVREGGSPEEPNPPAYYERLISGVNAGFVDNQPITVSVPIPQGKTADDLKAIDVYIALKGSLVGSYTITDVIVDSTRQFAQGITLKSTTAAIPVLTFPKEDDEDDSPYLGYHNFQYDDDGNFTQGDYYSDSPMYARIKPAGPTIAPDDPNHVQPGKTESDDSSIHGAAYPDLMPGNYPLDWLPINEGIVNENPYVLFSFEEMDLTFTIDEEEDQNGVKTGKHKIVYHTKKRPAK